MPSETPAVLNQTPGASIIVDGERYTNVAFSVSIPQGWRVITAAAESAPAVTFVAPDNCTLIHLSTLSTDAPVAPACELPTQTIMRDVQLDDRIIYVAGSAPLGTWEGFTAIVDETIASLEEESS